MSQDEDAIASRLDALMAEYHQQLPERIAALEGMLAAAMATDDNTRHISDMMFVLHKLAGSGATFGYDQLTVVARRWEKQLHPVVKQHGTLSRAELQSMSSMADELRKAAATHKPD